MSTALHSSAHSEFLLGKLDTYLAMEHAQVGTGEDPACQSSSFPSNTQTDKNVLTERVFTHGQVDWIYFVAFASTAGGIVLYSYKYGSFHHHFRYGCNLARLHIWFLLLLRLRGLWLHAGAPMRWRRHRSPGPATSMARTGTRRLERRTQCEALVPAMAAPSPLSSKEVPSAARHPGGY